MGKLQQTSVPLNEADGMRACIAACERDVTAPTAQNVAGIFKLLDSAERTAAKLDEDGADMRPELTRIDSLHERIARNAAKLTKLLGGTAAYASLRDGLKPITNGPAWQLDRMLAEQRARRIRSLSMAAILIAVLAGAAWAFRATLFPPDPFGDIARDALRILESGGAPKQALEKIDAGLVISPSNPLMLTWRSALLLDSDPAGAQQAADRASTLVGRRDFLLERATLNIQLNRPSAVLADANALIDAEPELAEAYYLRASAYELRDELKPAVADLQKCAELAEAQGNDTLFANARVRLGNLTQRIGY